MFTPLVLLTILALAEAPPDASSSTPATQTDTFQPAPTWKPRGPSLWFDPRTRRLILRARVVLREGPLEHLMCLKGTKEHEAILATSAVPTQIHLGLILTGAEPGRPVQFVPRFEPPTGSPIAIDLEWQEGKTRHANAREWVMDERTKAPLKIDWVFAGSQFVDDPLSKKRYYSADDGDLITVANFANAILDLPFASTANDADRVFAANTDRIPPRGTFVTVRFHPLPAQPKPGNEPATRR